MFDLHHLLLFGLPENKLEWFDGRTTCRLPFATRAEAEAAFLRCTETLARWQGMEGTPPVARRGDQWRAAASGSRLQLTARVLEASVPIYPEALLEFEARYWQPSLWPRDEAAPPRGGSGCCEWSETRNNILFYLMGLTDGRRNGWSNGRVDVVLPGLAIIQPHAFYYGPDRHGCLIDDAYFVGPPDLIIEVLAPATTAWTRSFRADLYCRAGVPHFWLAVPETEALETWEARGGRYRQTGAYTGGQRFTHPLFPDSELDVQEMLQSARGRARVAGGDGEHEPDWQAAPNRPVPLHNLVLGAHPDRRYEAIDGRSPCIVAFGSEAVAEQRCREWAAEIARWDNAPVDGHDRVRTSHFDLRRDGPRVALDIEVGQPTCEEILRAYQNGDAWDEYNDALDELGE